MNIKRDYPDYAAIEEHIRRAHLERSLALSQLIVDLGMQAWKGGKRFLALVAEFAGAKRARTAPARGLRKLEIEPYLGR